MDCLYRRNALGRIYKSAPTAYEIFFQQPHITNLCLHFLNRVCSRDIEYCYNKRLIHRHPILGFNSGMDTFNQGKDAFIDLLILAKAKLIYATGSRFVDVARYFNPQMKIISLDQRRMSQGKKQYAYA